MVPLRSAHAEKPSGATVPTLARKIASNTEQDFNHFDVGKRRDDPGVEPGRAQPISDFIETDILPYFTDWTVSEITTPLEFQAPTQSEPGFVRFGVDVHYNAHGKELGAVAMVFYGRDVEGNWHILHGASPETREPSLVEVIDGNSLNLGAPAELRADVILPRVDPTDPTTQITEAKPVVISLPSVSAEVPPDPTEVRFQIPSPSP